MRILGKSEIKNTTDYTGNKGRFRRYAIYKSGRRFPYIVIEVQKWEGEKQVSIPVAAFLYTKDMWEFFHGAITI